MNGQTNYYYGYFSNMSDEDLVLLLIPCYLTKRIIENKFLRNHEHVVDFIENAPVCAYAFDNEGQILWMNTLQHNILGCNEVETNGKKVIDVSRFLATMISKYNLFTVINLPLCRCLPLKHQLKVSTIIY